MGEGRAKGMDPYELKRLLRAVREGDIDLDDALDRLSLLPYENLGCARVDHHRALRHGFSEVVFGPGKTAGQFLSIFQALVAQSPRVIGTRVPDESAHAVLQALPETRWHELPRLLVYEQQPLQRIPGVAVVSAGTSDLSVAEEAALTAETMGNGVDRYYDVGVAGLHRLIDVLPALQASRVLVVVAGMEGALPSVVGGLVSVPVIAVPTSVGYGASFGGISALLGMLNSCASGVCVVNIDNGFGAGTIASMINRGGRD